MVTVELKPGGEDVPVTEDNKKEYVNCVVEYRISRRVKDQFEAFMSGFSELIPQDLINVFDERELELLIGGMSEIDVYVASGLCVAATARLTDLFAAMTGASSRTTVDTRSTTRSSSGSGSACVAGHRSASRGCCSSLPAHPEFPSTVSRICRARTAHGASPSRSREIPANCRRVIRALTVSTCRRTRTMPRLSRSSRWL